eukprot:EG_transcript_28239
MDAIWRDLQDELDLLTHRHAAQTALPPDGAQRPPSLPARPPPPSRPSSRPSRRKRPREGPTPQPPDEGMPCPLVNVTPLLLHPWQGAPRKPRRSPTAADALPCPLPIGQALPSPAAAPSGRCLTPEWAPPSPQSLALSWPPPQVLLGSECHPACLPPSPMRCGVGEVALRAGF